MDVANKIIALGALPFNPLLLSFHFIVHNTPYDDVINLCLGYVERCDAIYRIPGKSKGADREMKHAITRGIPHFHTMESLEFWLYVQANPNGTDENVGDVD